MSANPGLAIRSKDAVRIFDAVRGEAAPAAKQNKKRPPNLSLYGLSAVLVDDLLVLIDEYAFSLPTEFVTAEDFMDEPYLARNGLEARSEHTLELVQEDLPVEVRDKVTHAKSATGLVVGPLNCYDHYDQNRVFSTYYDYLGFVIPPGIWGLRFRTEGVERVLSVERHMKAKDGTKFATHHQFPPNAKHFTVMPVSQTKDGQPTELIIRLSDGIRFRPSDVETLWRRDAQEEPSTEADH